MVPWSRFIRLSFIWMVHTDDIGVYYCLCSIKIPIMSCLVHPTRHQNYVSDENTIHKHEEPELTNSRDMTHAATSK